MKDKRTSGRKKAGRPTTYKPEYCELLLQDAKQGHSFEAFGAVAKCHKDSLYEWSKKYQEFSDAKKQAFTLSLRFWESLLIAAAIGLKKHPITGQAINPNITAIIFVLKCRFGYREAGEVNPSDIAKAVHLVYRSKNKCDKLLSNDRK